jgi:Fe-S cluster biogenesis protein NfuA
MSEVHTTEAKVIEALEQLRPHLQFDGGDIRLLAVDGNTVHVELTGACSNCAISATTKAGVERAIKAAVPSVTEVRATTAASVQ